MGSLAFKNGSLEDASVCAAVNSEIVSAAARVDHKGKIAAVEIAAIQKFLLSTVIMNDTAFSQ